MNKNEIMEIVDSIFDRYVDFCKRIVKTPSLQSHEDEVAQIYAEEMKALGYDEVFFDDYGSVAGIIRGQKDGPVLAFNGHMDAVTEGDSSLWEHDPYLGEVIEMEAAILDTAEKELTEVIYGRGAADMKCGGASGVYAGAVLIEMMKRGFILKGTCMVQAVVLEENGEGMGTDKMVDYLKANDYPMPDAGFFGEPTALNLILGHRGRMEIKVTVYGQSCHGSSPWLGVNAMSKAAALIVGIEDRFEKEKAQDEDLGASSMALTMLNLEPCDLCIVPDKVEMVFDRRLTGDETVESAIKQIQKVIDEFAEKDPQFRAEVAVNRNLRTAYTGKSDWIESKREVCKMEKDNLFVQTCEEAIREINKDFTVGYMGASTDINVFLWKLKVPAVLYSGCQMLAGVHSPNEYARLDYLKEAITGNVLMYIKAMELDKDDFRI